MNYFKYTALEATGEEVNGVVEANNEVDAIKHLRGLGLYPTKIAPSPPPPDKDYQGPETAPIPPKNRYKEPFKLDTISFISGCAFTTVFLTILYLIIK